MRKKDEGLEEYFKRLNKSDGGGGWMMEIDDPFRWIP